ncbi:MAG: sulfur carrier protein ThiS [Gammaproteobacteria bacterium]|nr:sulfur carrier protein ThiS [Gammaproteobacteria bacterium]
MQLLVNGAAHAAADGTTLAELAAGLALRGRYAIEVNGEIVPRSRYASTILNGGDRVEVVQAVGGG